MEYLGFLKPPDESATSVWDDPSDIPLQSWNPLGSTRALVYEIQFFKNRFLEVIEIMFHASPLSVLVLVACILICIRPLRESVSDSDVLYPLVASIVYTLPLCIVYTLPLCIFYTEPRYFWMVNLLLLLTGGMLLSRLFQMSFFNNRSLRAAALVILVCSFGIIPVYSMKKNFRTGWDEYCLSWKLKAAYGIHGNIASNDYWHKSLYLAYHLKVRYFGKAREGISMEQLLKDLADNEIEYYFVWNGKIVNSDFDSRYEEIANIAKVTDYPFTLRIYHRKSQ